MKGGVACAAGVIVVTLLGPGAPLLAQTQNLLDGGASAWSVRQDRVGRGDPPRLNATGEGLRVRTGAAAIFYRGDARAEGSYRVELQVVQFDPGGRNEGFGIIFGGSRLDGPDQAYGYLLIRQDGMVLLKRREGERTPIVEDWFLAQALNRWADRPESADHVANLVGLEVESGNIRVFANGVQILETNSGALPTEGEVGLRVNHGVDIRVDEFRILRPEGPPPP